jgi:serine/threonine-protein kinase
VEGTPFGRYRLIELLGRGDMGEVWRAFDTDTDRIVAIKLLPAHFSDNEEFQRRFRREADAASRLNTPHVVPIHNCGEIDGRLYVGMRLIEGRDLEAVLAKGPLEPGRAVRIIEQVARALHAAHKVGQVHRDVKPSNILLDEDDYAYLIHFGIARAAGETSLTHTGGFIGSWPYRAPERFSAQEADARADVYALACVLYECLTGDTPYPGDSLEQQYAGHVATPPPQPSSTNPDLPADFDRVTEKGLAKDPDQRYATTVELANAAHDAITMPLAAPSKPTLHAEATRRAPAPARPDDQMRPMQLPAPRAVRKRSAEPAQPATPQRRPGRPPVPQHRPADRPPPQPSHTETAGAAAPTPRGGMGLIALIVVILAAAMLRAHSLAAQTQTAQPSGQAGQPAAPSGPTVLPFTSLGYPSGVAADGAGNLYVTDMGNNRVLKLAAGLSTQTVLPFTGLLSPVAVAVDGAGNLYVSDDGNDQVVKLAAGSSTPSVLPFTDLNRPDGVAVDSAGNLYVADEGNNQVVKLAAGSSTQSVLPFTGLNRPNGVAVDSAGNLYVADEGNNQVVKLAAGSSTQSVLPFTGLNSPEGVAVDPAGNLYFTDTGNNRVLNLPAGSASQDVLPFTGLAGPYGVAVDAAGNLYVTDSGNNRVVKLPAG